MRPASQAEAGPAASVLVLDNHDDFGGHAKRNEFKVGGRTLLGFGGTWSIDSPAPYSAVAKALIAELGIDVLGGRSIMDWRLYGSLNLGSGIFFDKETFGADRLIPAPVRRRRGVGETTGDPWAAFMAEAPMSEAAKRDVKRVHEESVDYMPGLSTAAKRQKLAAISYAKFLTDVAKLDAGVLPFFQARPHGLYGVGIDAVPAQDAFGLGMPGAQGMNLGTAPGVGQGLDAIRSHEAEEYFLHFPDGNAGIARLIVRWLIPTALPGSTMEDSVATRVRYAALDEDTSAVRVRLDSTVVAVTHGGERRTASDVVVTYVKRGKAYRARGGCCVLACYNAMIPYLCPELPETQKVALHQAVRKPYVYTNVAVRNWKAFEKLGISDVSCPGAYYRSIMLDWGVSIGDYRCARTPDDPMVVHVSKAVVRPGLPARDQFRVGRQELLETSFESFERNTRDLLARVLSDGGFDPARDIAAISVNRWPHGYAGGQNELFDPDWGYDEVPWVVGRKRFGRIAIANSDAAAVCLTSAAFDQAHRAVDELLTDVIRPDFQYPWAERA